MQGRPVANEMAVAWTERGRMAELYERHAPDAARLAYFLVGDRDMAQDLVQDAFMRAFGRWENLRRPGAFWPYMCRTMVNLSRKHFRRRRIERLFLERERRYPAQGGNPPDLGTRDELWQALHALPLRQRTALVLRYYADFSESQTADAMRCSTAAVNSLVARGVAAMRSRMSEAKD